MITMNITTSVLPADFNFAEDYMIHVEINKKMTEAECIKFNRVVNEKLDHIMADLIYSEDPEEKSTTFELYPTDDKNKRDIDLSQLAKDMANVGKKVWQNDTVFCSCDH